MQINDNSGKKIGRLDTSVSKDRVVKVHEIRNITTITTRDGNTGKVKTRLQSAIRLLGKWVANATTPI